MPDETKPVDEATMLTWNAFVNFNKQKGYAGDPKLDHDPKLRQKIIDEFNSENPKTPIDPTIISDVQAAMIDYKQKVVSAIKTGKVQFGDGVNENNFMSNISKVDGVLGQLTSQWAFPSNFYLDKQTGQKKEIGLAPHHDIIQQIKNLPTQ